MLRVDICQPCGDPSRKPPRRAFLDQLSGRVVLRPSIEVASRRVASCLAQILKGVGQVLGRRGFLPNLLKSPHHRLPLSCQCSQYCHCAWAICQLVVENIIRRRIRQYRHGLSYARSATMTDETLTTVLLLSHERGHTGQLRVTGNTCTVEHHTVPGKEISKSQESCTVPDNVLSVNREEGREREREERDDEQ